MLEANNWYAAAALSRQLVEVEYLAGSSQPTRMKLKLG